MLLFGACTLHPYCTEPHPPQTDCRTVSGKKGAGSRPTSSQAGGGGGGGEQGGERQRQRRKSVDSERGSEAGGRKSAGGGAVLSRLEQHERMLAERERERRESALGNTRLSVAGRQPSRSDLRPRSVTDDSDREPVPSYMRSTSASIKKEKPVATSPAGERVRRRSATSQSQGDLRRLDRSAADSSSEEEAAGWAGQAGKHSRAASQDRRHTPDRSGPGRAKSERDLSRVARVNLGGGGRESGPGRQRTKMKTTTIISSEGSVVVQQPPHQPQLTTRGSEAVDVTRAPLSRQLAEVSEANMWIVLVS